MTGAKTVPLGEGGPWDELARLQVDIHFHPRYLALFEEHLQARCWLHYMPTTNGFIAYPFFRRKLPGIDWWDVVSPWYYGGPIFHGEVSNAEVEIFLSGFTNYCQRENIVSEFTRLHPHLNNHQQLEKIIELPVIGKTIWIDLTQDPDMLYKQSFTKACRWAIRKCEKLGVEISLGGGEAELRKFHHLYTQSMKAKQAQPFYFFSYDFLWGLYQNLRNHFLLAIATIENELVAAIIFLYDHRRIYYYLGARALDRPETNASHRLLYEAVQFGHAHGLAIFDIGGGPEGSGLLRFKESFSQNYHLLHGIRRVHHLGRYHQLCEKRGLTEILYEAAPYFPEYRS